ncbi:hypothetical protein SAMD00019534_089690 [Acytostelium subglobosum LB1]|uniref:hypothetical protein n=1 Tax=Acytostelium subglobosum LB1 TaxID=1410327 RepID=UPI000644BA22|nr:hypothetical protein SAMD00019534_089690 [Acytostelium subglobosum LB1]GAM25794.1 hypothetical protein SAMD00019534_089690 [Acytostelium subglobosum LB1]|eukprot:XP_012751312.1 hypothetical protein SAMD00019534_089690 [Acytostelium subglobosum LB1]
MSAEHATTEAMEAPKGVEFSTLNEPDGSGWSQVWKDTGIVYLSGAFVGATSGAFSGIREAGVQKGFKPRMNAVLDHTGSGAARLANNGAAMALTFGLLRKCLSISTGLDDNSIFCSVTSGAMVGAVVKAPGGYVKSAIGASIGGVIGLFSSLGQARRPQYR